MSIDVSTLADCPVINEYGKAVGLGTLWSEHPAIIVFLRHFACIACRANAVEVWSNRQMLESGGAKIYFVGNGSASFIPVFREDLGLQGAEIFTDPSLVSFRVAGFKRGFLDSHGPASVRNGLRLHSEGHRQKLPSKEKGDIWQLGGTIVIAPSGQVTYHYISLALGDFPPSGDIESA